VIDFIEDSNTRHNIGTDLFQHFIGDLKLALKAGIAGIDDVEQQRGIKRFVERGLERRDEAVRQVLDETDRVADQHARHAFRVEGTHGGVERREQFVGNQHFAAGKRAHQGGFAGIGIADKRHASEPLAFLPAGSLRLAFGLHRDDFQLQLGDTVADLATV